jgi:hypothetical protein
MRAEQASRARQRASARKTPGSGGQSFVSFHRGVCGTNVRAALEWHNTPLPADAPAAYAAPVMAAALDQTKEA